MDPLRFIVSRRMLSTAKNKNRALSALDILLVSLLWLTGCAAPLAPDSSMVRASSSPDTVTTARAPAATPVLQRLADEAAALRPLASSFLTQRFLDATGSLPTIAPRAAFLNEVTREYFSAAEKSALPATAQKKLTEVQFDEYRYYFTKSGSPLAYLRPLELAATNGFDNIAGKRILDFGYGGIGHLRLLASLGAHVTGIDPDSYLDALYSSDRDQGAVPPATGMRKGHPGTIALAHGYWPKEPRMVARVGQGYDLILSKNTLKKGYVKPDRKIDKRLQINLGVSDESFLKAIHDALNPGGKLIIYNLYPKPPAGKNAYDPQADARSPFSREQYEKAGLQVLAINAEDHTMARRMGRALKWDKNDAGDLNSDLEISLFAMFTVATRPAR